MLQNVSGQTYTQQSRYIPNDSLWMDPESGTISVVFTAPSAGTYTIQGYFQAADANDPDNQHPVEILHGSNVVWSGTLIAFMDTANFNFTQTLASGDTLTFSVLTGTASVCAECYLSTAFDAVVSSP
jgi:hypothetical protein